MISLAFVYLPIHVRLTRAEVLSQKARGFVEAARAASRSEISSVSPGLAISLTVFGLAVPGNALERRYEGG